MPSDSEDKDDNSLVLASVPALPTAIIVSTTGPKEHSLSTRIKAIYILEEKKSLAQIKGVTGVPKTTVY